MTDNDTLINTIVRTRRQPIAYTHENRTAINEWYDPTLSANTQLIRLQAAQLQATTPTLYDRGNLAENDPDGITNQLAAAIITARTEQRFRR